MSFVHLHNHTEYSVLDGACRIDKMFKMAIDMGMPAVAITDHGNIYGSIEFYKKAAEINKDMQIIKPIIGMEAYLVEHDYDHPQTKDDTLYHVVLLVKDDVGYNNLLKITTKSFVDGFYYKPRVSKSILKQHADGLICLSGCVQGELAIKAYSSSREETLKTLEFYKETFKDDFYIELQNHGIEKELKTMPILIEIAKETNTPMVVTNDCHYMTKEEFEAHEILMCIQFERKISDLNRYTFPNMYFKSEAEMRLLFPEIEEAINNTLVIADKCNFHLHYDDYLLPKIDLPKKYNTEAEYLKDLCYSAIERKYPNCDESIMLRIDYELSVINKMGFDGYFLIVKDIIDAAVARKIPVGPGRGSACGSIIAYLLGITKVDPLKYDLFFERFLNPDRGSMPDIDIDFSKNGRNDIIDYIKERYGRESVAQIITFGTLATKSAIKDVARVLEVPLAEADYLTKLIPNDPKLTLKKLKSGEYLQELKKKQVSSNVIQKLEEFVSATEENELYKKVYENAILLEGLVRHTGVHAAGVVIVPGDISDVVPLAVAKPKDEDKSVKAKNMADEKVILIQYEGKWLDKLKLLKMDILSINYLAVIDEAIKLVYENKNIKIDIDNIPFDDKKTYELLSTGKTEGVFQFESDGMTKYLGEMKPNKLSDLIAMVALYRPGPMDYIDTFIKRKHGIEEIVYDHPNLKDVLGETYGVTIYQEQVMQASQIIAGFSGTDADTLRQAMGKKIKTLMVSLKEKFITGAKQNGVDDVLIEKIWADWQKFSEYAFNKSHSAGYAILAYQTAYLKANYPVEYMTALLSQEDDTRKIPYQINAVKKMNIEVLPPTINRSNKEFTIKDNKIVFGLGAVKNVGNVAVSAIIKERDENGDYKNIFEFARRIENSAVNKAVLESLVMAGILDELPGNRAQQFKAIENVLHLASVYQKNRKSNQMTIFSIMEGDEQDLGDYQLPKVDDDWTLKEKLENEIKVLGVYVSNHPLFENEYLTRFYSNTKSIDILNDNHIFPETITIIGIINSVIKKISKKGNDYFEIALEDLYGPFEMTLFNSDMKKYEDILQVGKKIFISAEINNFQKGNTKLLRMNPKYIMPIEIIERKLTGTMHLNITEEILNQDFISFLEKYKKNHSIKFRVVFHIYKDEKKICVMKSDKYAIPASQDFIEEVCNKRGLSFHCIVDEDKKKWSV